MSFIKCLLNFHIYKRYQEIDTINTNPNIVDICIKCGKRKYIFKNKIKKV